MRKTWTRWKFHLSALVLVASVWYGPGYISGAHWADMGERVLSPVAVGPYRATLSEAAVVAPERDPYGKLIKTYNVILSSEGARDVQAAYLRVGKPRSTKAAGAILHGNPYRLHAHVPFPDAFGPEDELWLTVETWTGEVHQTAWPLAEALGVLRAPTQTAQVR
ncbi:MAG: hypothetical protein VR70_03220 [Rhodospirillaceae bacterium BRH_c57]|nr:MAG: hypothetical protein VR70_03220 [Rhodospirillaceae bacterium BRH_c57]